MQFPVSDDQEVAATAGGIQNSQPAELLMEPLELALVSPDPIELGSKVVEKQRPYHFEDVAFAGVVSPHLAGAGSITP